MVSSQEKIKIRFLLRRIGFLSILGAKPNAMKKTLQLLAAVAALLLPAVSCEDLFRPDKPAGPPEIYYTVPEACDHAGEEDVTPPRSGSTASRCSSPRARSATPST